MPDDNNGQGPTNTLPPVNLPVQEATSDANASTPEPTPTPEPVDSTPVPNPAAVQAPEVPDETAAETAPVQSEIPTEVVRKIGEAHNVLIALSSDPSVDEMCAAIGLSLYLDKLGKRATAIYSGATPNALEFLKPEETFESSADTLQDFVIALNKEKADHLRYKLDGDFVKIYITPYRTKIVEEDLDFSYGDFNVDLVLALDVANGIDLDSALREHGRIMHDASIVNITTGNPGKLGEIEWSDKSASSVSEMVARLLYSINGKTEIEKEEATAFLTGIVAATNRFSNATTTPETMKLASRLMESGANQQLISKNITPDIENEMINMMSISEPTKKADAGDPTKLDIEHGNEEGVDESKEVDTVVTEKESTLLDDLKAAEENLAHAGDVTVPEEKEEPIKVDEGSENSELPDLQAAAAEISNANLEEEPAAEEPAEETAIEQPVVEPAPEKPTSTEPATDEPAAEAEKTEEHKSEKVIQPSADMLSSTSDEESEKYGQMLEDALESVGAANPEPEQAIMSPADNPASASAPEVPTKPEINGVPEINYMPMPGDEVLPPPPAPPLDMSGDASSMPPAAPVNVAPIAPAAPATESTPEPLGAQPAMQDQVYAPQAADPGAFKIPGM